jgi:DNA-binding NarL/FixJ family response regulator
MSNAASYHQAMRDRIEALYLQFHELVGTTKPPDTTTDERHQIMSELLRLGVPPHDIAERLRISEAVIRGVGEVVDPSEA